MISSEFAPSQVEINSLGIGILNSSNLDDLDLSSREYLVVGEQTHSSSNSKYSFIVNNHIVGVNTTRERIDSSRDGSVKTSSFYTDSDIICNGNIIARGLQFGDIKLDGYNSNVLENILTAISSTQEKFYTGFGALKNMDASNLYPMAIDNIYTPSFVTIGTEPDTYNNTNPLNIVSPANYNIDNVHISLQNNITNDDNEYSKMRIGIVGNTVESPAVISTSAGMPLTFHIGLTTDQINNLYSDETGLPNYDINSNIKSSLTIDTYGNVGIGVTKTNLISFNRYNAFDDKNISKETVEIRPKMQVTGCLQTDDIILYDYFSHSNLHIDDIYVRKKGLNFEANQIIAGDFIKGAFTFNSNLFIGKQGDEYTLEVNNIVDVKGDLLVSNQATLNKINVKNDAIFENIVQFYDTIHMEDAVVGGNLSINSGDLKIDNKRININEMHPVMIDAEIAAASNINGSNILFFASSDILNFSSGSNLVVPGRLGVGVLQNDDYNEKFNVIKRNDIQYELMLEDASSESTDITLPKFYMGHLGGLNDVNYIKDRSVILNTNDIDGLHNIYFYPGVNIVRNKINDYVPTLSVNQNNKVGINVIHPLYSLHVNGDILCKDLYFDVNNTPSKGLVFISKKDTTARFGDFSKDIYYLYDQNGSDKFCINFADTSSINLKGLNVKGGINSINEGFYENNVKLTPLKIIDSGTEKYAYTNKHITIGYSDDGSFATAKPLVIRNISTDAYNDSIIRIYKGKERGAVNKNAEFSGIDICEYDMSYTTNGRLDRNLYKWFMYKNHNFESSDSKVVGPLQFGYTHGTQHPTNYGMSMYYNTKTDKYHVDVNNPTVITNIDNVKSAMTIYGDLEVLGSVNIKGSSNYQINGINVSVNAIQNLTSPLTDIVDNQTGASESLNDVVITGKKIAMLPDKTLAIGHLNQGFASYLNRIGDNGSEYVVPLTVYQKNKGSSISSFISSEDNQIDVNSASVDLTVFNVTETSDIVGSADYTGKKKNSVQLKVSNYGPNSTNLKSIFEISSYNASTTNYDKMVALYHNGSTSYMNIGHKSYLNVNNFDLENIALHIENPSKYLLQLTNYTNAPAINFHRKNGERNRFWVIEASDDNDHFNIKRGSTSNSYIPNDNSLKNVLVLSNDKMGINVDSPIFTLDVKGGKDEPGLCLINTYADVQSNIITGTPYVTNSKLQISALGSNYDYMTNTYYSGIKYSVANSNIPLDDASQNYLLYNFITEDVLVYSNLQASNIITLPFQYELTISSNNDHLNINISNYAITYTNENLNNNYTINNTIRINPSFVYIPRGDLVIKDDNFITKQSILHTQITINEMYDLDFNLYNFQNLQNANHNYSYNTDYILPYDRECTSNIYSSYYLSSSNSPGGYIINMFTSNLIETYIGDPVTCDKFFEKTMKTNVVLNDHLINYILTSNVLYYNSHDEYDIDLLVNMDIRYNYITNILAPPVILNNNASNTYSSNITDVGSYSKTIVVDSVTTFLNNNPSGKHIQEFETIYVNNYLLQESLELYGNTYQWNVTINNKYNSYSFLDEKNIQNYPMDISYLAINSKKYQPHIVLQNDVDFNELGNIQYGMANKIYSKNGAIEIVTDDDINTNTIWKVDKMGDMRVYGGLTVDGDIDATQTNNGKLHVNTLILNGDVLDRLGNSMLFNYSEDMYNQAFVMQSSNYILYTSNYSIHSTCNLEFVLQGDYQQGFKIIKESNNSHSNYNIFDIQDGDKKVLSVVAGGHIGIKKDASSNYDLDIASNLRVPMIKADYINANGSLLNNVNIRDRNTNMLSEGSSNLYYSSNRVLGVIDKITLDYIKQGTSNNYIYNNKWDNKNGVPLTVSGNFLVGGNVGLQKGADSRYSLDIEYDMRVSTIYSRYIKTDGSLVSNINLQDRDTNMLKELPNSSNLYYTASRVGIICSASNLNISNFVYHTSNILSDLIVLKDGYMSNYVHSTSNYISSYMSSVDNNISNYVNINSQIVSESLKNVVADSISDGLSKKFIIDNVYSSNLSIYGSITSSNIILHGTTNGDLISASINEEELMTLNSSGDLNVSGKITGNQFQGDGSLLENVNITDLNTDKLPGGESNLYYSDERVYNVIHSSTLDQIQNGTSNVFFTRGFDGSTLTITGNISVTGTITSSGANQALTIQSSSNTSIIIDAGVDTNPNLVIKRNDNEIDFINMSNSINYDIFNITGAGKVGIGMHPLNISPYLLEVNGALKASSLYGNGANLNNVNLSDRNTNMVREITGVSSNLYYTASRVGVIATASNIETSNYISNTSNSIINVISSRISNVSNYIANTSNVISLWLNSNDNIMSNYVEVTSNVISSSLNSRNTNMSNYVSGTSNAISLWINTKDSNMSNYLINTSNSIATWVASKNSEIANFISTGSYWIGNTDNISYGDVHVYLNKIEIPVYSYSLIHPNIVDSGDGNMIPKLISGNDYYYEFASTYGASTIEFTQDTVCDILLVAGGGGGGRDGGGGGGAGGVIYKQGVTLNGTYQITVGKGGLCAADRISDNTAGALVGENTVFSKGSLTYTALGGGGGKSANILNNVFNGGSGGGGSGSIDSKSGGAAILDSQEMYQGKNGGDGIVAGGLSVGGGGGGAGSSGTNGIESTDEVTIRTSGNGGNGISNNITGTAKYYSGGGRGGRTSEIQSSIGNNGLGYDYYGGGGVGGDTGETNKTNGQQGILIIRWVAPTQTSTIFSEATTKSNVSSLWTSNVEYINHDKINVYNDAIQIAHPNNTAILNYYAYYKFNNKATLLFDHSLHNRPLTNYNNALYYHDSYNGRNSMLFYTRAYATFANDYWDIYNNIVISGWFKLTHNYTGNLFTIKGVTPSNINALSITSVGSQFIFKIKDTTVYTTKGSEFIQNDWNYINWNITNNQTYNGTVKINNNTSNFISTVSSPFVDAYIYNNETSPDNVINISSGLPINAGNNPEYLFDGIVGNMGGKWKTNGGFGSSDGVFINSKYNSFMTYYDNVWSLNVNTNIIPPHSELYFGEYLRFDLKEPTILKSFTMKHLTQDGTANPINAPKAFKIFASNDATKWQNICTISSQRFTQDGITSTFTLSYDIPITTNKAYKNYLVVVNSVYGSTDTGVIGDFFISFNETYKEYFLSINEIILYTYPSYQNVIGNQSSTDYIGRLYVSDFAISVNNAQLYIPNYTTLVDNFYVETEVTKLSNSITNTSNWITGTSNVISARVTAHDINFTNTSNWIGNIQNRLSDSISIWRVEVNTSSSTKTFDISKVSYKLSLDSIGNYYKVFDVTVKALSNQTDNILIYSFSITVSYNASKTLQGVSYMVYSSYYALNTISDITNGISFSGNTIVFTNTDITITPTTDFTITILSR